MSERSLERGFQESVLTPNVRHPGDVLNSQTCQSGIQKMKIWEQTPGSVRYAVR